MFFDELASGKKEAKPRLRLAGFYDSQDLSARERLSAAKLRREETGPSLLDRIVEPERTDRDFSAASNVVQPEILRETSARMQDEAQTRYANQDGALPQGPQTHWQPSGSSGNEHGPLIDPFHVIDALRRLKYLIAATTILGGVLGTVVAINTPKLFGSTAQILIDPRNYKVIENDINPDVFLSEAALAIVDSQVNILRSPIVLDKVAKKLGLDKDPEFNGTKTGIFGSLKKVFSAFSSENEDGSRITTAIRNLNESTEIDRQPGTFIVNIKAKSEDAQKAAVIANAIADVYMEERAIGRSSTASKATGALESRLPELKKQVEQAETAVASFKAQNDLFDAQGRQIDDDSIVRLNEQLNAARITTVNLNAKATTAKALTADTLASGDLPEELSSNTLGTLRGRYTQALQRVEGLQAKLGPMHPDLKQAQGEAASLRTSIDQEIRRVRSSIQTELKRAVQTEQELAGNLARLKAKMADDAGPMVELRELERTAASARQVYEQFLLRAQETSEQGSIDSTNVTKTNPAQPQSEPEGTSRKLIVIAGALAGFLAGLGIAIAKGMWDALMVQYAARQRRDGFPPSPLAPAPVTPNPFPKGRGFLRGTFQSSTPNHQSGALAGANLAHDQALPMQAGTQQDKSNPMYPYPPVMSSPYAPMQGWGTPVLPPVPYGMPVMPHMMAPQMMPQMQMPGLYSQPQFVPQMMPHPFMPHPVIVHNYPAPAQQVQTPPAPAAASSVPVREAELPRQVNVAEIKAETPAPKPFRPLPTGDDIDDIRDQLAGMRAELMDLARQRRRA